MAPQEGPLGLKLPTLRLSLRLTQPLLAPSLLSTMQLLQGTASLTSRCNDCSVMLQHARLSSTAAPCTESMQIVVTCALEKDEWRPLFQDEAEAPQVSGACHMH